MYKKVKLKEITSKLDIVLSSSMTYNQGDTDSQTSNQCPNQHRGFPRRALTATIKACHSPQQREVPPTHIPPCRPPLATLRKEF